MKQFIFSIVLVFCFIDVYSQEIVWRRIYNDTLTEHPQTIKQTRDSSYIICGYQKVLGANNFDAWLMKIDENGEIIWSKSYGDSLVHDYIYDIAVDKDNIVFACGVRRVLDLYNLWLLKIDSTGNVIWDSTYSNIYGIEPLSNNIILDETGNIIIAGSFDFDMNYHKPKAYISKLNQNGDLLWLSLCSLQYDYGEIFFCDVVEIARISDYLICGRSIVYDWPDWGWLRRYDKNGNFIWQISFNNWFLHNIELSDDNCYIVSGTGLMKTSETGVCWINNNYTSYQQDLLKLTKDNFIAVGNTRNHKIIDSMSVVKFNGDGDISYVFSNSFSSGVYQRAKSICESHENGYLILGEIGINDYQAFIIKYTDPVGVEETEVLLDNHMICNVRYIVENSKINIEFILDNNEEISLKLYDVSGRLIISHPLKLYFQGTNTISFDMGNSGIYFLRFEFSDSIHDAKLVVF